MRKLFVLMDEAGAAALETDALARRVHGSPSNPTPYSNLIEAGMAIYSRRYAGPLCERCSAAAN
jgi:hypothetical protein